MFIDEIWLSSCMLSASDRFESNETETMRIKCANTAAKHTIYDALDCSAFEFNSRIKQWKRNEVQKRMYCIYGYKL